MRISASAIFPGCVRIGKGWVKIGMCGHEVDILRVWHALQIGGYIPENTFSDIVLQPVRKIVETGAVPFHDAIAIPDLC